MDEAAVEVFFLRLKQLVAFGDITTANIYEYTDHTSWNESMDPLGMIQFEFQSFDGRAVVFLRFESCSSQGHYLINRQAQEVRQ